jgi:hypothetical protein
LGKKDVGSVWRENHDWYIEDYWHQLLLYVEHRVVRKIGRKIERLIKIPSLKPATEKAVSTLALDLY